MVAIEEARSARTANGDGEVRTIVVSFVTPGSVNCALEPLRMAAKLDRYRSSPRMMLEPWLVQEALSSDAHHSFRSPPRLRRAPAARQKSDDAERRVMFLQGCGGVRLVLACRH
jgi:hypothetical protein